MVCQTPGSTPAATTRTSRSSSPVAGRSISRNSKTSGADPYRSWTIAFRTAKCIVRSVQIRDPSHRYARMRWNTPLSEVHAELLLSRLAVEPGSTVLDLGCGWGELLLRAVAGGGPDAQGVGVDSDQELLRRGEGLAAERGLGDRVQFVCEPAADWANAAGQGDLRRCVAGVGRRAGCARTALPADPPRRPAAVRRRLLGAAADRGRGGNLHDGSTARHPRRAGTGSRLAGALADHRRPA